MSEAGKHTDELQSFFGAVDMQDGHIASEYPSWGFGSHLDEMEESLAAEKRRLERGEIPEAYIGDVKASIRKSEKRLGEILSSRPNIEGPEKDRLAKAYSEMGEGIGETLFTRDEMKKGTADAHEEARRMTEPVVKVNSQEMADACARCGIKVKSGNRITRNDASKVLKILGKYLGEPTNIETLRRDK